MPRFVFCCYFVNVLNRNRKRPYIVTLVIISLLITIIVDVIFFKYIQTFFYPFDSLSCYRIENLNAFPDISEIKTREGKAIFFHETSCKSHTEGKTILNSRQACAVESAAKSNPYFDVFVLFTSPGIFINNNTESDRFIKVLLSYPNIKFFHVNYKNYTEGTPVESLYKSGKIETSYYAISHASDVLRYLTLWKFGGIYLDLDVIVMRSLEGLRSNYAGAESDDNVAAGVMNFAPDGLGHFLAEECLIDLSEHFTGYDWGHNGPGVITRLLRRICRAKKAKDMVNRNCRGFTVHPPEYFYPIPWWNWTMYFDEKYREQVIKKIKNSYVVHVWNKHSEKSKITVDSNVPYAFLAKKYCPKVFAESSEFI